jgi:hypothetical protein
MAKVAPLANHPRVFVPALALALGTALACALAAPRASAQTPSPTAAPIPGEEDTDGDGIPDNEDACKRVKGVASETPKLNGCPPPPPAVDTDGDGIADSDDACPKKPGVASDDPKLNGCPARGAKASARTVGRAAAATAAGSGSAALTFAGFRRFDDGSSLVFVELSAPVAVDVKQLHGAIVYTLENTKAPGRNSRNPLDTSAFSSVVRRATVAQKKKNVEITLTLTADVQPQHRLVQRAGATVLEIQLPTAPPGSAPPAPSAPIMPKAQ